YQTMSTVDANAVNVDARHVQNLTINITYHTGPMINPPPPPPMIEISQTSPSLPDSRGGGPVGDSVDLASEEEFVAARIEVSQKPPPSPESGGGPVADSVNPASEEALVAEIEGSQKPPPNPDSRRERMTDSVEFACLEEVVAG
ncbi:hypothetical protein PILCRDRAFT_830248, partial [Piloderma croceum F 1598]